MPENFDVTAAEIASTPNFGDSHAAFGWCWLAIITVLEILAALSISAADWAKHWLSYVFAGLFLVIVFGLPAGIGAYLLCLALDRALPIIWPKYARVRRFRVLENQYRVALSAYDAWVSRQAVSFWTSLDGISFERELGRLFKSMGYAVSATRQTGDGGVDLILEHAGKRTVVQCKAHASKVGIATARELVASMIDFQAQNGILAVTSGVTKPVTEYVRGKNIEIYDLARILRLQREHG